MLLDVLFPFPFHSVRDCVRNEVCKLNDLKEDADLHLFSVRTIASQIMSSGVCGEES